jgi:hypothetical protein
MSQMQELGRCLLANGYAWIPGGDSYLLYVDSNTSSLICKCWTGNAFTDQMLITTNVRPNSTASYLFDPTGQVAPYVVCISPSSTLCALRYNDVEEDWIDDDCVAPCKVHPSGKLAAFFSADKRICIFFQDPLGRLIYLSSSGDIVVLAAAVVVGSPISATNIDDTWYVFYISAEDNRIHYVFRGHAGEWHDAIFGKCTMPANIKQFVVKPIHERDTFTVYLLTERKTLLRVTQEGGQTLLGTMDETGEFVSAIHADRCCNDAWNGTLTADALASYLTGDPSVINTSCGDKFVTPLAAACWNGHLDVVHLLLVAGADPNALSAQNRTPLYYATARSPPGNRSAIVRALLDAGARIDACYADNDFYTPLMNAIAIVSDKDVVRELVKRGASMTARNVQGQTVSMLAEGTEMEAELPKCPKLRKEEEKSNDNLDPSQTERWLVNLIVALMSLFMTYIGREVVQEVVDEVVSELMFHIGDDEV